MLHIQFLPIESSIPRPLMTEQLPLPFDATGMDKIPRGGLSTHFLDNTSRLRLEVLAAAVMTGQRTSQPHKLTVAAARLRMKKLAICKALTLESGVSHG